MNGCEKNEEEDRENLPCHEAKKKTYFEEEEEVVEEEGPRFLVVESG